MTIIGILVAVSLIIIYFIVIYNSLIHLRSQVKEAWSGIDVQLKRRYNLIPNLIATVQGYQKHESSTLEEITKLRATAMSSMNVADKAKAESALGLGLGRLLAVAEAYPDLKASQNFLQLQSELSDVEEHIQDARRYYNGTVREFNSKIQSFPPVIVAKSLKFTAFNFFEIQDDAEKAVPRVNF